MPFIDFDLRIMLEPSRKGKLDSFLQCFILAYLLNKANNALVARFGQDFKSSQSHVSRQNEIFWSIAFESRGQYG